MIKHLVILICLVFIPGFLLVVNLYRVNSYSSFLLVFSLSFGAGAGIFSILFFLWSLLFYPGYSVVGFISFVAVVIVAFIAFTIKKRLKDLLGIFSIVRHINLITVILVISFIVSSVFAVIELAKIFFELPNGGWDAWAIWNLRARFIFFGKQDWHVSFSPELSWSHIDYPLLLPSLIAGNCAVLGQYSRKVPIIIAFLFYLNLVMVFIGVVWKSKGINLALLGGIVLSTLPDYIYQSASQYADVPLAFFFLASCVLVYTSEIEGEQNLVPYLLGIFVGIAAWTKNEGLSFVVALLLSKLIIILFATRLSLSRKLQIRQSMKIVLGLLLPLLALSLFKSSFPYKNDILGHLDVSTIVNLLSSGDRYKKIFIAFVQQFVNFGGLKFPLGIFPLMVIYGLIMGKKRFNSHNFSAIIQIILILLIMFLQYFAIYLITPHPLDWHIATTIDRLIMQLFPSILFTLLIIFMDPFEIPLHKHNCNYQKG
jgi:hypothetical protein